MKHFKIVVLSGESVKYTYAGQFETMEEAILHYKRPHNRIVEAKELNVRLKPISRQQSGDAA